MAAARLGERADQLETRLEGFVARDDLAKILEQALNKLERGVDARFAHQTRSVEALRAMVGQTDELLQKVLDGLESIRNDRDMAETRN